MLTRVMGTDRWTDTGGDNNPAAEEARGLKKMGFKENIGILFWLQVI